MIVRLATAIGHDIGPVRELDRIKRFLRRVDDGASTSVRPFVAGLGYFNSDLPNVYDRNFLLVTADSDRAAVAWAAEELQGGAGLSHRKVVFEHEDGGERVAPALGDDGWEHRRLAIMVFRGRPDGEAAREASEVDRRALIPALEELIRSEPWGGDEDVVRQLSAADLAIARSVEQRCFARLVDGKVVASCRLYSDGEIAQIEDVATLPGHRQRGYARAAVARAAREANFRHGLVFLTAVDGRWVKRWYERLGFEQVGLRYEATRPA
jgi:ribosomal protein S18 acetylase RimI-like enzyme